MIGKTQHDMLCLCHALSCRAAVMARHKMPFHAILCYFALSISCHAIILCFALLCYEMLYCAMLTHLDERDISSFPSPKTSQK